METLAELETEFKDFDRDELLKLVLSLKSEVAYLKKFFYSSKREQRIIHAEGQGKLFNEAEHYLEESEELQSSEEKPSKSDDSSKSDHKPEKKRKKTLSDKLPRLKTTIELDDDKKVCSVGGGKLKEIGKTTTEKLEFLPAKALVIEETTVKYKCTCCEDNIVAPEKEPSPIPGSFATPSLLSAILTYKYIDGMPLYRQQRIFSRFGVGIDRTTMASWVVKMGNSFNPLVNCIHEDLLEQNSLHCDETTVQVLKEKNKSAKSKSYMWALGSNGDLNAVLFKYFPNRSADAAIELLTGFTGTLICDGYGSYNKAARELGFKLSGCFAHVRRKFHHAEEVAIKASPKKKTRATEALNLIDELYEIERKIKDQPPDKILEKRKLDSKPVFQRLEAWLLNMKEKILPSSPTGKAISYALRQWGKMELFLEDASISIDNNYIERSIRPFVIGRKGWLFSQSVAGAEASANIYTLVESAKLNFLDPSEYLTLIIKELTKAENAEDFEKLLPYNVAKYHDIKSYESSK